MATKRQVEGKLRELIGRMDQADDRVRGSLAEALPEARVVEVTVSDLDAIYWSELAAGRMSTLRRGAAEHADIRIRVNSEDLVGLVDGQKSLFSSFVAGHVNIEASFSDLLRLKRLL